MEEITAVVAVVLVGWFGSSIDDGFSMMGHLRHNGRSLQRVTAVQRQTLKVLETADLTLFQISFRHDTLLLRVGDSVSVRCSIYLQYRSQG
jgi:ABC-type uncharacterized transport system YnjBCD ATPase subunit